MINKKYFIQILCLIFLVCSTSGCEQYARFFKRRKQKNERIDATIKSKLPKKIESIELAEIILKIEPVELSVERDPFKPLLHESKVSTKTVVSVDQETLRTVKILGITKMGKVYSVLMSIKGSKGVYSINDSAAGFEIVEIASDYIVLKKENKTFTIKRGENE